jgi:LPXTG-motif cell wall-anchored protein
MKKAILTFSLIFMLSAWGDNFVNSQDQPKPKKDTVNMDTDAKPTFYYAEDDENASKEKGSGTTIAIISGAVIIVGGGILLLRRKK